MTFRPVDARYIRITAKNPGLIPEGNPGAGKNSWIFFDEIIIE
jgi:hexosaminidase